MSRRHLLHPHLSAATKAKAYLVALSGQIAAAKRRGDKVAVEKLEKEKAWLTINSLTS